MPNSEGAMSEVDWNDDEAVVKAAYGVGWEVRSEWLGDYSYDGNYIEVSRLEPSGWSGDEELVSDGNWHEIGRSLLQDPAAAWANARKNSGDVQAYELAHNPAKRPQPPVVSIVEPCLTCGTVYPTNPCKVCGDRRKPQPSERSTPLTRGNIKTWDCHHPLCKGSSAGPCDDCLSHTNEVSERSTPGESPIENEQAVRAAIGGGGSCWAGWGDKPNIYRIWSRALPGGTDPASQLLGTGTTPESAWEDARKNVCPDPQPSPVDHRFYSGNEGRCSVSIQNESKTEWHICGLERHQHHEPAKPVDDLGELERLRKALSLAAWFVRQHGGNEIADDLEAACSPDRIESLFQRVREAEILAAMWKKTCSFARQADTLKLEAAEQSLQADREKSARLEEELSRLRFASSYEGLQDGEEN